MSTPKQVQMYWLLQCTSASFWQASGSSDNLGSFLTENTKVTRQLPILFFFVSQILYLFILERDEGREKERERNIDQLYLLGAQNGPQACELRVCPDWKLNNTLWLCGKMLNQLGHTGQGRVTYALHLPVYLQLQLLPRLPPQKTNCCLFSCHISSGFKITNNMTSSQDGGVGRHTVPPRTTKRTTTI